MLSLRLPRREVNIRIYLLPNRVIGVNRFISNVFPAAVTGQICGSSFTSQQTSIIRRVNRRKANVIDSKASFSEECGRFTVSAAAAPVTKSNTIEEINGKLLETF